MKDLQKKIDDYKARTLRYSYMDDYQNNIVNIFILLKIIIFLIILKTL